MNFNCETDAPLLIVLGQSNAHGHGTHLPQTEWITNPLRNVHGLACRENQKYDLTDVEWSGFVTAGMNLGETQDNTYCLAEGFARKWQNAIDDGTKLPDLYVIQISIGAQGITEYELDGLNMWYPNRPRIMKPSSLDGVDISLYPLAVQILSLAVKNLKCQGKTPKIIGLHWNQWETEVATDGEAIEHAKKNFTEFFDGLKQATGIPTPIYLYCPLSEVYNNPKAVKAITAVFRELETLDGFDMINLAMSPLYDTKRQDKGIFQSDLVHYSPEAQRWFAEYQWAQIYEDGERL